MSEIPKVSRGRQAAQDSAVAIISSIPIVGALAAPFLISELTRVHSKKRDAWLNKLENRLNQLQDEGIVNLEMLFSNEKFLELVYFVIQQGQATLNDEKHQMLSDVVINYSQNLSMDDDKKYIFMKYIEQFTPSHIALLKLLSAPKKYYEQTHIPWPNLSAGGRTHIISGAFPSWNSEFINLLYEDLKTAGLIQSTSLGGTMTGPGLEQPLSTALGHEFLVFVQPSV